MQQPLEYELAENRRLENQSLPVETIIPKVKHQLLMASLCRSVLDPRDFNNYLFWELIYNKKISNRVTAALDKLDFKNGSKTSSDKQGVLLDTSRNTHYFACWPDIEDIITSFKTVIGKEELKNILLSCCINPTVKSKLSPLIDAEFGYKLSKPINSGHKANEISSSRGDILRNFHFQSFRASILLRVLGGFIATLGALTIVLAFTLLNPPSTISVAVSGVAALVVGLGIFKIGRDKSSVLSQDESLTLSLALRT